MLVRKLKNALKSGLAGILASGMIFSACNDGIKIVESSSNVLKRDGYYSGAIVFAYNGSEIPQSYINNQCDPAFQESIASVPGWYENQAKAYKQTSKMPLDCFAFNQEKVPNNFYVSNIDAIKPELDNFATQLRGKDPMLNNYDFLGIVYLNSLEEVRMGTFGIASQESRSFLVAMNPLTVELNENLGEIAAHESLHLQGAEDKYNADWQDCKTGPNGKPYSGYDIMCALVWDESYQIYSRPPLEKLQITEPTAREIGWLSGN